MFVEVLSYLKESGKYCSINYLSAILILLEFIQLSCKNFVHFFVKPCKGAKPYYIYKDLSLSLCGFIFYIFYCLRIKETVILPHKHHACISVSTFMHLKERVDLLQGGIVLCFCNLQDYVLIWCCFFFYFETCFQKHMLFHHKIANMSYVREIFL